MILHSPRSLSFFFNDTATTEIYTLSLHDALPIYCPLSETENHFQWVNNWTKQTANHTIKWGVDIRRAQTTRIDSGNHRSGELTFPDSVTGSTDVDTVAAGSATTGLGLATYLLGQPSFIARNFTGPGFYPSIRQTRLYFFGQDSWRATTKLTVNYGLRYENYLPQTGAKPGSGGSFYPTTGDVLGAGVGLGPAQFGGQAYKFRVCSRPCLADLKPARTFGAAWLRAWF